MIYSSITIKEENMKDLTKAELIQKLENLSHLKTTVHAKDVQIAELKKQHEEKIKRLNKEKEDLVKKYTGSITKEQIDKVTEKLIEERNEAVKKANLYIKIHHDLLKQIQHTTEMALFSEQLVSEKFKIRGDK